MGKKGTAIKKTAENCILTDDNYCQNSILFFNVKFCVLEENGIQMLHHNKLVKHQAIPASSDTWLQLHIWNITPKRPEMTKLA